MKTGRLTLDGIRRVTGGDPHPDPDDDAIAAPRTDQASALQEFRDYLTASRQHLDNIARAFGNNGNPAVLETRTIVIPPAGFVERSFRVPYAAVDVANLSSGQAVVTSASAQGPTPPGGGQGQITLPGHSWRAWNMAGQALTIYGNPGATVSYSVLLDRIQPGAGQLPASGIAATATFAAAATGTATLPPGAALAGFTVTYGAFATSNFVNVNVTGAVGGTLTYTLGLNTGSTQPFKESETFNPPLAPANPAVGISVSSAGGANSPPGFLVVSGTAP